MSYSMVVFVVIVVVAVVIFVVFFFFLFLFFFFFFQAEDGIRDIGVTGVQTCALPIYSYYNSLPRNFFLFTCHSKTIYHRQQSQLIMY